MTDVIEGPSPSLADGVPGQVFGMVVKLKAGSEDEYRRLHADGNPGVRDLLVKYHLRNFHIFLQRMPDGHLYEFGTYTYMGTDRERDMRLLNAEPRNAAWLEVCDPMQESITAGTAGWTMSELVYHND